MAISNHRREKPAFVDIQDFDSDIYIEGNKVLLKRNCFPVINPLTSLNVAQLNDQVESTYWDRLNSEIEIKSFVKV